MKNRCFLQKYIPFGLFFLLFSFAAKLSAQCDPVFPSPLSARNANYDISLTLDHVAKKITAKQTVTWRNISPDTIRDLRFYMYMNAFKNTESTYLKGARSIFGQDYADRKAEEWGWIRVDAMKESGTEPQQRVSQPFRSKYIQPDDGNTDDQTVLQVLLNKPLLPGETIVLDMDFTVKMPATISRSGYSKDDFFLMVHWFPQMCVYDKKVSGDWAWNSHQFHRRTEFFADFGNYDVKLTTSKHLKIGASGCLMDKKDNADGTVTRRYLVQDVIDFAWTAYPYFCEMEDKWEHVNLHLLIPEEHKHLGTRYLNAVKHAFAYMDKHVGNYPYKTLTIVDPPFHGLRSSMMEYPTLITVASFYKFPEGIRTIEALVMHEFLHQYFMEMLATNEKEEAWMDEGFVTYFEDRIVDDYFGKKESVVDIAGYHFGSRELSRIEYTGMDDPHVGAPARPGWEITEGFKELLYSKPATTLHSVEAIIGEAAMDSVMMTYFRRFSFSHPKAPDFLGILHEVIQREKGIMMADMVLAMFKESIFGTSVCDYELHAINNTALNPPSGLFDSEKGNLVYKKGEKQEQTIMAQVILHQHGDMRVPTEVEIHFDDGSVVMEQWNGEGGSKTFEYVGTKKIVSAHIDPAQKIRLDIDLNNNSMTLEPDKAPLWKYAAKALFWVQNAFMAFG